MLEDHPLLRIDHEVRLPLLTPFNSSTPKEIEEEVERRLEEGFRTFKIKVGTMRMRISSVRTIQRAIAGRAAMRIDGQSRL
jgi:L-Ala-D/L-Glu epimerase / N-acetyl-D-glutamate racemase